MLSVVDSRANQWVKMQIRREKMGGIFGGGTETANDEERKKEEKKKRRKFSSFQRDQ